MALFQVIDIVDGNTIKVSGWKWGNFEGQIVKIAGFTVKGAEYNAFAKGKLTTLLKDKQVDLKNVITAEKGTSDKNDVITCSVYLNDLNISQYFPEISPTT